MANETQKQPPQDYEQQLYDQITRAKGEGAPLSDPVPATEWLAREAEGDPDLQYLLEQKEGLDNSYIGKSDHKNHDRQYIRRNENLLSEIVIKNLVKRVDKDQTET